jgi:hypothetical protein
MIYICSLYSNGIDVNNPTHLKLLEHRVTCTAKQALLLNSSGLACFSTIVQTHGINNMNHLDYVNAKAVCENQIKACKGLIVFKMVDALGSWKNSKGMQAEIEYAKSLGLPIDYVEMDYV